MTTVAEGNPPENAAEFDYNTNQGVEWEDTDGRSPPCGPGRKYPAETSKMSTIPVQLPDDLQAFVETNVQRGQFASANEYIVALVDAARRKRSEIEVALMDGLESGPAEEWTEQEWAAMKRI